MLGSNPSADAEAGMAGRRVYRLPHQFRRSRGAAGFGGVASNCATTQLFWHERPYPGFLIEPALRARAVRGKWQITSGIGDREVLEGENSLCCDHIASVQSVFSASFARRAKAVRERRSILARPALSFRCCLVAA